MKALRAAEFFAGIGLMRMGLEDAGINTVWANDIDAGKRDLYVANFGDREFRLADVREVSGEQVPTVDLATASFPCTDLSLAGNRRGLGTASGSINDERGSSMFWEFARVLDEMGSRRPPAVLLENVLGFASSHGGADLRAAILELNRLGYSCDLMSIDARHFVPQSRPRMFIVGLMEPGAEDAWSVLADRPSWVHRLSRDEPRVRLHARQLPPFPVTPAGLDDVVERLAAEAGEWWDNERVARFVGSLTPIQLDRLSMLRESESLSWRTAYRRTRAGMATWEIRADRIAGCLRTARGGSSRQALVEAGLGSVRVRWMLPVEYARLMGAPDYKLNVRRNQALFGFGDAVCVPVVYWLCRHYGLNVRAPRVEMAQAA